MKKITVFTAIILALCLLCMPFELKAADNIILPDNAYMARNGKYRMQIYDIEDGYMHVPFLPELPTHNYKWEYLELDKETGFLSYLDKNYPNAKVGIDVSKYQGEIDWQPVKESGIDFVIVRLGYRGYSNGKLMLDPKFVSHMDGAAEAGLGVGVYFFSQAINEEEAREEALFVIEQLKDYNIEYSVTFDAEKIKFDTSRTESLKVKELTQITKTFCDMIKDAGLHPMIYANSQWLTKKLDLTQLTDYDIWYADYEYMDNGNTPLYPYEFRMWQYSDKGRVEGINTDVDLNILFE